MCWEVSESFSLSLGAPEKEEEKTPFFLSHLRRVRLPNGADRDAGGGNVDSLGLHAGAVVCVCLKKKVVEEKRKKGAAL